MGNHIASMGKICIDFIYSDVERLPKLGEEVFSKGFTIALGGGPDPLIITSVISTGDDRSFVSWQPERAGSGKTQTFYATEGQVYDLYKGCRIAYVTLGYDDVWKRLKKEGSILVMDTAWYDDLHLDWYKNIFPYIDYLTPNEIEAPKLTNTGSPEEALDVLAEYIPNPIVKLSKDGCIIKENGKTVHIKADGRFAGVDPTGAGDAFLAGLMYGIYKGHNTRDSVIMGNIAGGSCVTQIGCLAAELDEATLRRYYREFPQER